MSASITLDELTLLTDDASDRAADEAQGYHFEVSADGTEWKNAEAVITEVQSQLFDGQAIALGSYSNMEVPLFVRVVAQDSALLASGCAQLIRVLRRRGMRALTYLAPDGASPATVFDVLHITPSMQVDFGNLDENHNIRTYALRMLCKPFPRSDTEIFTEGATVGAPTFADIDTLATSTAWTVQDPAATSSEMRSWTPLRYNVMPRPLVSDTAKTQGWAAGSNATSISWALGSGYGDTGDMVVTGKPTSSSQRVFANGARATLVGTGAVRVRFPMGSAFACTFGMLYRWFNSSGKQIGADHTITEVPRTASVHTISALITPVSGAVSVSVYPYTKFTNSTGGIRTYTTSRVYIGPDGASFYGNTPHTSTIAYDWTGSSYASSQVELGYATKVSASGSVSVTAYHHPAGGLTPVLTRTATLTTTSSAPYLAVSGQITGAPASIQIHGIPGRSWVSPDVVTAAADGTFKAYFRIGDQSLTVARFRITPSGTASATTAMLKVTKLESATSLPTIGTGRQAKFSVDVEGTMPAEASLQIANTGGVGRNVLVYTGPTNPDFMPALSPSLVASGTADATTISNKKFTIPTSSPSAETWKVSHVGLVESTYALFAKLAGSGLTSGSAYTFSITQHTSFDGGTSYYGDTATVTGKVLASATTFDGVAQIATLRLPTVDLDNLTVGTEGLKLWVSGGTWVLDEAWLFDMVNGSWSHVLMPSTSYANVTIQAASPDRPQQRYMVVNPDDSVRSLDRSVQIWGNHRLDPAVGCDVFAICDAGSPDLSVSASYFPRWDVFAAPVDGEGTS